MDDQTELTISIAQADSLKKMQKMPGWKIIEGFLGKYEAEGYKQLQDIQNKDLADIQAFRMVIKFVKDFKDLLRYTQISAEEDQRELNRIKGKEER